MYQADEAWREVLRETTILDLVKQVESEVPEEILSENKQWIEERLKS